jgi:hypothetical protein
MLGKLSWAALPLDQPIPLVAGCLAFGIVGGLGRRIFGENGSPASTISISA